MQLLFGLGLWFWCDNKKSKIVVSERKSISIIFITFWFVKFRILFTLSPNQIFLGLLSLSKACCEFSNFVITKMVCSNKLYLPNKEPHDGCLKSFFLVCCDYRLLVSVLQVKSHYAFNFTMCCTYVFPLKFGIDGRIFEFCPQDIGCSNSKEYVGYFTKNVEHVIHLWH